MNVLSLCKETPLINIYWPLHRQRRKEKGEEKPTSSPQAIASPHQATTGRP